MAIREVAVASTDSPPGVEDVRSVGSRISWGAIVAGCVLAIALLYLLTVLGSAVGVSVSNRVEPANLRLGAVIWTIVTTCAALFVGGMVVSQLTVGENKWEAVVYGVIMWALLFTLLLGISATGVRVGFNTLVGMANMEDGTMAWDAAKPENQQATAEAVRRNTWYAFGGLWVSMISAAAGTLVGAGPTFRLVVTARPRVQV